MVKNWGRQQLVADRILINNVVKVLLENRNSLGITVSTNITDTTKGSDSPQENAW
jgi:hypothetical protein